MPYWSFLWLPADADEAARRVPGPLTDEAWEAKADTAFWRGSSTGGYWNESNWRTGGRYRLVKKCEARPDVCDAAITAIVQARGQAGG